MPWKKSKTFVVQKGEGAVDHSTITIKKFYSDCKNLNDQLVWTESVLQAIEVNPATTWKSIRQAWYLTVQCGSSLSQPLQEYPELPNCASHY